MHPSANPLDLEPIDSSESHIFISYSRQDIAFVRRFARDLQQQGVNIWIDKLGLKAGTPDWEQALRDAIRESHAVLLVASESSRRSPYVNDEIAIARMYRKPIYPVWAAGTEWMEAITMGMGRTQFIDARGEAYAGAVTEAAAAVAGDRPDLKLPEDQEPDKDETGEVKKAEESGRDVSRASEQTQTARRNPYKGLRAFRAEDRADFHGRKSLIQVMLQDLREYPNFLALLGASGSGKSSVIMAGVLPALSDGALPGSERWTQLAPFVPSEHPIRALAETLALAMPQKPVFTIEEELRHPSAQGLASLSRQILAMRTDTRVVLYVDQFEELFTQTSDAAERTQFVNLLTTAANDPESRLTILISMRADFYDQPLQYPDLGRLIEAQSRAILPMTLAELYDVVERPAASAGLTFDDGLVGELIFDVRDQAGALPLLQFTLEQLYEQREGLRLTHAAYRALGGVKGALAGHAEATYEALPDDAHRALAKALFLRLIEPGATRQDTTRRRAPVSELTLPDPDQTKRLASVMRAFVKARLLITDRIARVDTVEVSHEALIREWKRLGDWLREAREDVLLQKAVANDAADWSERGRTPDRLYRGTPLIEAQAWAARATPSRLEDEFLRESAAEEARQRERDLKIARRVQNFQRASIGFGVMLVLAIAASIYAGSTALSSTYTQETAEAARQTALADVAYAQALNAAILSEQETAVAQGATAQADRDIARTQQAAANLAADLRATSAALDSTFIAVVNTQSADARAELAQVNATLTPIPLTLQAAADQQATLQGMGTQTTTDLYLSRSLLLAEQSRQQILNGSQQNALIQAVESSRNHAIVPNDESTSALLNAVAFPVYAQAELTGMVFWNNDRTRLAQLVDDSVIFRDAPFDAPRDPLSARMYIGGVWSPDSRLFAARTADSQIDVWDAQAGARLDQVVIERYFDQRATIRQIQFSADSTLLMIHWDYPSASGGIIDIYPVGGDARVLDADTRRTAHQIIAAELSPVDNRLAVLYTEDLILWLEMWDAERGDLLYVEQVFDTNSYIYDLADQELWSPDGESLWIPPGASEDAPAQIRSAADGTIQLTMPLESDLSLRQAWVGSSRFLALGYGFDLEIFDTQTRQTVSRFNRSSSGRFFQNDDATMLLLPGSFQTDAYRIDPETGASELIGSHAHDDLPSIETVAWNDDASRVALIDLAGHVTIYDISVYLDPVVGFTTASTPDEDTTEHHIAWSPDGSTILTTANGPDGSMGTLWRFDPPVQGVTALPHDCPVDDADLSRDGGRIITDSSDLLIMWDRAARRPLWQSSPPGTEPGAVDRQRVYDITFSPDDQALLVQVGFTEILYELHDADDYAAIWETPVALGSRVYWSPDGTRLLSVVNVIDETGRVAGFVNVVDAATAETLLSLPPTSQDVGFSDAQWSADGSQILAWSDSIDEPRAWIWDAETGELLTSFLIAEPILGGSGGGGGGGGGGARCSPDFRVESLNVTISGARWGADVNTLVAWGADGVLRRWDVEAQTERWRVNFNGDDAAVSDDGSMVLVWNNEGWKIFDMATGEPVNTWQFGDHVPTRVEWTPLQTGVFMRYEDGAQVFDLTTESIRLNYPLANKGAMLTEDEQWVMFWGDWSSVGDWGDVLIVPTNFAALWEAAQQMIVVERTDVEREALYLPLR